MVLHVCGHTEGITTIQLDANRPGDEQISISAARRILPGHCVLES